MQTVYCVAASVLQGIRMSYLTKGLTVRLRTTLLPQHLQKQHCTSSTSKSGSMHQHKFSQDHELLVTYSTALMATIHKTSISLWNSGSLAAKE